MTYAITQPCVDVVDPCADECSGDRTYEGVRSLRVQPDKCVDCGAREPVCPAEGTQ